MAKEGIGHGSADTVDKSNISQHFYIDPLRAKSTVKHDNVRYKTIFIEYIYWYWYLLNRINKLIDSIIQHHCWSYFAPGFS